MAKTKIEFKTHGEFLRAAYAFVFGRTKRDHGDKKGGALRHVLISPRADGGVFVIGCDGAAMMVQVDRRGSATVPILLDLDGVLDSDMRDKVENRMIYSVVVKGTPEKVAFSGRDVDVTHTRIAMPESLAASQNKGYPNWRSVLPTQEQVEAMVEGFPGHMNIGFLATLSRLWPEDGQDRSVAALHDPKAGVAGKIIIGFPWRPESMLVMMPMNHDGFDFPLLGELYCGVDLDDVPDDEDEL